MQVNHIHHRPRSAALGRVVACLAALVLFMGCGESHESVSGGLPPLNPNPTLTIGVEQQRPAKVILPRDYDIAKRYPLVILLHGFGANGAEQDFIFHLGQRTTDYQFILILPDGTRSSQGLRFWDATPECCNFNDPPVDDVAYLAALMNEAKAIYAVDPKRIRLVGHSNGAYMSYRYICEHPVPVDRIVVLAGSVFLDPASCRDPKPVEIIHTQGTNDDTVPYEANPPVGGDPDQLYTVCAAAAIDRWAHVAGCAEPPDLIESRDYHQRLAVNGNPAETEIYRYHGCAAGKRIELWKSIGGDHIFLSANDAWRDEIAAFVSQ